MFNIKYPIYVWSVFQKYIACSTVRILGSKILCVISSQNSYFNIITYEIILVTKIVYVPFMSITFVFISLMINKPI